MTEKQRLQLLVEQLPDDDVHTALRFVESLSDSIDPVARAFDAAPVDEECLTPAERAAFDETDAEINRRDLVSHHDARRMLQGRSPNDYRLRVGGWRILLSRIVADRTLVIRSVLPRGDAH